MVIKKQKTKKTKSKTTKVNILKEDVKKDLNEEIDSIDIIINFFKNLFISKESEKSVEKEKTKLKVNKKAVGYTIILLFIFIIMLYLFWQNIQRQMNFNQKPELISSWAPQYKGQVGMPVYYNHQFVIDNGAQEIKIYKKLEGILEDVISLDYVPSWVAETSQGIILVKALNSDNLYFYKNKKLEKILSLPSFNLSSNFNLDSKDNIYYADVAQAKILKYDLDGNRLLEISGYGKTKDKFQKIGRIFFDKNDNIYAYDISTPPKIKVFTSEGKFIKEINLGLKELTGRESIAVTHDGNIYMNDLFELVIRIYSPKGKLLGKFKTDITGRYNIGIPNCLSGGIDNIIYVHTQAFRPIKY